MATILIRLGKELLLAQNRIVIRLKRNPFAIESPKILDDV